MPPGALAVNTSRLKHDTRNKSTTSSMRQRTQAPPPPHTSVVPPPPHTTVAPPLPHTTATLSPPLTAPTPPLPQTIEAVSQPQTTDTSQTFEESTFVPTPGVTHHVLQGPAVNHTTIAGEEDERDQTVSDEEEEAAEQAFADGQRPMSIVGNGIVSLNLRIEEKRDMHTLICLNLLFNGSRVLTPKYKICFIKLVVKEYLIYLNSKMSLDKIRLIEHQPKGGGPYHGTRKS
ncbi:unnamed protein product [Vicia faba]|uniref:Uncharacterized protein n=1 Tax=Vicia faba TaxID=3906 RepID=A0AAV1A6P3_VICFA|nr:unnamed protein product [Vicia faba]